MMAECDVSQLLPPMPFDIRWVRAVNGRLPSSVALDAKAKAGPCPTRLVCEDRSCDGLDVPQHLFGDDDCQCACSLTEGSAPLPSAACDS